MAIGSSGFYSGLQNHASVGSNPRYQVIFSGWQYGTTDSYPIDYGKNSRCGQFGGEGTGWNCKLQVPWQPGQAYRFHVRKRSASQESVGEYGLGLWPSHVSPSQVLRSGTDLSLFVSIVGSTSLPTFVATLRVPQQHNLLHVTGAHSFVENWSTFVSSCTQSKQRSVELQRVQWRNGRATSSKWSPVRRARFSAVFKLWHNEICVVYGYGAVKPTSDAEPRFLWSIGGRDCQSPPAHEGNRPTVDLDAWSLAGQQAQLQGGCNAYAVSTTASTSTASSSSCFCHWLCAGHQHHTWFSCPTIQNTKFFSFL